MKKKFLVTIICLLSLVMFSTTGCTMFKQTLEPTLTEIINSDKTYTYKNLKNKIIFDHISCKLMFKNGYSVINDGEKYGVVNTRAEYVIPAIYDSIRDENGLYVCLTETVDGIKTFFIDVTGNVKYSFNTEFVQAFSDGLAAVMINNKWGYIDKTGKWVIKPQYGGYEDSDCRPFAGDFYKGYTGVYLGSGEVSPYDTNLIKTNLFAIIDKRGNIVKRYDFLLPIQNERGEQEYTVIKNNKSYLVNYCGKVIKEGWF